MARSRDSIAFIPWVLGSITPEISYKLVIAKCSSGIIDNLTCRVEICVCKCISHSIMFDSGTPWTIARQAPLSMEFSGQEYWGGLPCPPPGDLPQPRDQIQFSCT